MTRAAEATGRRTVPTKAAILARLKELHSSGLSIRKIAERLNAENFPTLSGTEGWNTGTISKLLKKTAPEK